MLCALAAGETNAEKLAELAQGKLKSKKSELRRALAGHLTPVQRWVLAELLTREEELEAARTRVETRIGEEVATCADPFVPAAMALPLRDTLGELGRGVSRQSRVSGQTQEWAAHQREQVLADDLRGSGVGRHPCQGHVPPGEVSALSEADAQAESLGGDCAPLVSD